MRTLAPELEHKCKTDLKRHEGIVLKTYIDSEGHLTFGIGHLITPDDFEWGFPAGIIVPMERVERVFDIDFKNAIDTAVSIIPDLMDHPENVQRVLINMAFNLGYRKLNKFKKMIKAINNRDYLTAAKEMIDSKWYGQVKTRGVELVALMRGDTDAS